MVLFESQRPNLLVHNTNNEIIAQFVDGKFETDDNKIIKVLLSIEHVEEVDLAGVYYFDAQAFENRTEPEQEVETPVVEPEIPVESNDPQTDEEIIEEETTDELPS